MQRLHGEEEWCGPLPAARASKQDEQLMLVWTQPKPHTASPVCVPPACPARLTIFMSTCSEGPLQSLAGSPTAQQQQWQAAAIKQSLQPAPLWLPRNMQICTPSPPACEMSSMGGQQHLNTQQGSRPTATLGTLS